MKSGLTLILTTLGLLLSIAPGISRAADIGWPEAVGRLAGERSKAEHCAAVLNRYGDKQQISLDMAFLIDYLLLAKIIE